MTVLLDTHVLQWWSAEPDRLSLPATQALDQASELVVAAVTWFELAWLARHERITVTIPIRSWLEQLAGEVRTGITPAIADTAVALLSSFSGGPGRSTHLRHRRRTWRASGDQGPTVAQSPPSDAAHDLVIRPSPLRRHGSSG